MKIIFLDFDGPLSNFRTWLQSGDNKSFDPLAVGGLDAICEASGAKIVCTSVRSWANDHANFADNKALFEAAGLHIRNLHPDWSCRTDNGKRESHIKSWLASHPGVTHYVIIDDDIVRLPNFVKVDCYDGILRKQFERMAKLLDFDLTDAFRYTRRKAYSYDQFRLELDPFDEQYNESIRVYHQNRLTPGSRDFK